MTASWHTQPPSTTTRGGKTVLTADIPSTLKTEFVGMGKENAKMYLDYRLCERRHPHDTGSDLRCPTQECRMENY